MGNRFVIDTAIVFFGSTAAGALNLVYRLICVRMLSPVDYGTLNALMAITVLVSTGFSPLQTACTRFFTEYIARSQYDVLYGMFRRLLKRFIIVAGGIVACCCIFNAQISAYMHTPGVYVCFAAVVMAVSVIIPLFIALVQSFQKFVAFAWIGFFSSFSKIAVGSIAMALGCGIAGGLAGFLAASLVGMGVSAYFSKKFFRAAQPASVRKAARVFLDLRPLVCFFLPVAGAMAAFSSLTAIDGIMVKHFFPLEAGFYAIAQNIASIGLFLPSSLVIVLFPKITEAMSSGSACAHIFHKALAFGAACCCCYVITAYAAPAFLLRVFTGSVHQASMPLVPVLSVAASFGALMNICLSVLFAARRMKFVWYLVCIGVLEVVVLYGLHNSLMHIAAVVTAACAAGFIVCFIAAQKACGVCVAAARV